MINNHHPYADVPCRPRARISPKIPTTMETSSGEVVGKIAPPLDISGVCSIPVDDFHRIVDIVCITEILRNLNVASLRDDEMRHFLELQSFFIRLESECLHEAGIR